jgi:murein DD-endopeptidase MepM/ murein hydrolase activator NlpD
MNILYPVDEKSIISQCFGITPYSDVYKQFGLTGHNGIDWAVATGSPIYACMDGVVSEIKKESTGYGTHLKIRHQQDGQYFLGIYGHLKEALVSAGETVKAGQIIARSNNTGFSTGPHLHFELRPLDAAGNKLYPGNGYDGAVDPYPMLVGTGIDPDEVVIAKATVAANVLNVRATPEYPNGRLIGSYLRGEKVDLVELVTVGSQQWGRVKKQQRTEWICVQFGESTLATVASVSMETQDPPPPASEPSDAEKLALLWADYLERM